jgi:hypothetical protein
MQDFSSTYLFEVFFCRINMSKKNILKFAWLMDSKLRDGILFYSLTLGLLYKNELMNY